MTFGKSRENSLKLKKALYRLKQAARALHLPFKILMQSKGFAKFKADPSFYMLSAESSMTYLLLYLSDVLTVGPNLSRFHRIADKISAKFEIRKKRSVSKLLEFI